jgi:hypothetical protein
LISQIDLKTDITGNYFRTTGDKKYPRYPGMVNENTIRSRIHQIDDQHESYSDDTVFNGITTSFLNCLNGELTRQKLQELANQIIDCNEFYQFLKLYAKDIPELVIYLAEASQNKDPSTREEALSIKDSFLENHNTPSRNALKAQLLYLRKQIQPTQRLNKRKAKNGQRIQRSFQEYFASAS